MRPQLANTLSEILWVHLSHTGFLIHGNCAIINLSCFNSSEFMVFVTKQEKTNTFFFLRHSTLIMPFLCFYSLNMVFMIKSNLNKNFLITFLASLFASWMLSLHSSQTNINLDVSCFPSTLCFMSQSKLWFASKPFTNALRLWWIPIILVPRGSFLTSLIALSALI